MTTINHTPDTIPENGIISMPAAYLRGADLSGRECNDMRGVDLIDANLDHTDFSGGTLKYAYMHVANASRACFDSTDLTRTHLAAANLREAKMSGANLDRTDLRRANLDMADMKQVKARYAQFNSALMAGVDMDGARFEDTSFHGAVLSGTARGASFDRCDMCHTLVGVDFTQADVASIRVNDNTNMKDAVVLRKQVKQFIAPTGKPCSERYLTSLGAHIVEK